MATLTNLGCYAQGGGFLTPPAYGTNENAGRNIFRGQPYFLHERSRSSLRPLARLKRYEVNDY
jgi:hypothetical protein